MDLIKTTFAVGQIIHEFVLTQFSAIQDDSTIMKMAFNWIMIFSIFIGITGNGEPFQNGSFEQGGAGWVGLDESTLSVVTEVGSNLLPSDGVSMLKFSVKEASNNPSIFQVFDTIPGTVYSVNFSAARVDSVSSGGILVSTHSSLGYRLGDGYAKTPTTHSWTTETFTFTALETETSLRATVHPNATPGSELLADDIQIIVLNEQPDRIADSIVDYSNQQGVDGWFYGFYDQSSDQDTGYDPVNDFQELISFKEFVGGFDQPGWVVSEQYWTFIGAQEMHPNSDVDNGGRTLDEHWAIRRWKSNTTGLIKITGRLSKPPTSLGGDGAKAMVFVNGRLIHEEFVEPLALASKSFSLDLGVQSGDLLDFAISDAGDVLADSVLFSIHIDSSPFVIKTAPAIEVSIPTIPGKMYQMFHSQDFQQWIEVGTPFEGNGENQYFFYSSREFKSPAYFRAELLQED